MKAIKPAYITIGTALLLASCAKEDVVPGSLTDDNRIIFRTSLPEVTSRATVVGQEDILDFHVTAFNPNDATLQDEDGNLSEFIKDVLVEKDASRGLYMSGNCLWPEQGHEEDELTFFAYYPARKEEAPLLNTSTISEDVASLEYAISNFHVASNIAEQEDFITAYTKGSMVKNMFSGISLDFQHKLSRIEVKAKSENKSCKLEIAGVRIGGSHTRATYNFKAVEEAGDWTIDETQEKEVVEYIYRAGDKIVELNDTKEAVSIMGGSNGINYAMLIPSSYTAWDFSKDNTNKNGGMFISVLLRVLDKTPGGNDKQQYPYHDKSQGLNALNIPRVYLAVDKTNETVTKRVYTEGNGYFTDEYCTQSYTLATDEEVREFGWAALPVTGNWEHGYAYTYTLDYTSGVGLHDPSVDDPTNSTYGPKAGDPIISDRVGVSVSVNEWQGDNKGNINTIHDVVVPGS